MASKIDIGVTQTWCLTYADGNFVWLDDATFRDALQVAMDKCVSDATVVNVFLESEGARLVKVAEQTLRGPKWIRADFKATL